MEISPQKLDHNPSTLICRNQYPRFLEPIVGVEDQAEEIQ